MKFLPHSSFNAAVAVLSIGVCTAFAADPFAENVRTTEPLTPEQQKKAFHVPEGFEVQLVAMEPDLRKPMNMAFDSRGRLWFTESREYPFPVPLDKVGRDTIRIASDFGPDGRARKVEIFAEGLNIPTGIYPYKNGVIAWSIPNIWFFEDTDGDGKADKKTKLFGPLGWERDTHGMDSSFRRGYDGWLYATHGFNNNTTIRGADGSEVVMNSGNTYRMRLDGSRVEQHTWGQVNPFGLCFDPLGNMYSADCHSAPVYQLVRGGYYPSFGKANDGLGFAPALMEHSHGSTAIAGILYLTDDAWPKEFMHNTIIGNVMTSRINRDRLDSKGTTKVAVEQPDFLSCDDPWFRPVDIQYGPDGALYIADFYNRIIGHYEVPLQHPGRDRERGRIWRVVYKGKDGKPSTPFDVSHAKVAELIKEMGSANPTRRMLAMNETVDRAEQGTAKELDKALRSKKLSTDQKVHVAWALQRLVPSLPSDLWMAAAKDSDPVVRVHAMHQIADVATPTPPQIDLLREALNDSSPVVQRAAAEALGLHPAVESLRRLLASRQLIDPVDTLFVYATRVAIRNQLRSPEVAKAVADEGISPALSEVESRTIADVSVAVPDPLIAIFLLRHTEKYEEPVANLMKYLGHAARYCPVDKIGDLAVQIEKRFGNAIDTQFDLFKAVETGLGQRGENAGERLHGWASRLAPKLLAAGADPHQFWHNEPAAGLPASTDPWVMQSRDSADGQKAGSFISSLPPGGESFTGVLHSPAFNAPTRLSFYVCGHDGYTDKAPQGRNKVLLREISTGEVLASTPPPRNDVAQHIEWNLAGHVGKNVHIEVIDTDTGDAYAWIAIGRIEPAVISIPTEAPRKNAEWSQSGAEMALRHNLRDLKPALVASVERATANPSLLKAASQTLAAWKSNEVWRALAPLTGEPTLSQILRARITGGLAIEGLGEPEIVASEVFRGAPGKIQQQFASALAGSRPGARILLAAVSAGAASPRLLVDQAVSDRLAGLNDPQLKGEQDRLTKNMPPANEAVQKIIDERRGHFVSAADRIASGAKLFTQNCAVCHQIGGQGNLVGPQLDGIGNRGLDRVAEDILDPNRNVDRAFRTTVLVLKDGDVASGLLRREEGETVVLADATGKEIVVQKKTIQERRESESSLMPANFGDVITPDDFNSLLNYLLAQKGR